MYAYRVKQRDLLSYGQGRLDYIIELSNGHIEEPGSIVLVSDGRIPSDYSKPFEPYQCYLCYSDHIEEYIVNAESSNKAGTFIRCCTPDKSS